MESQIRRGKPTEAAFDQLLRDGPMLLTALLEVAGGDDRDLAEIAARRLKNRAISSWFLVVPGGRRDMLGGEEPASLVPGLQAGAKAHAEAGPHGEGSRGARAMAIVGLACMGADARPARDVLTAAAEGADALLASLAKTALAALDGPRTWPLAR